LAAALRQGRSKSKPDAGAGKAGASSQGGEQEEERVVEVDAGDVVTRFKAFVDHARAGLEGAEVRRAVRLIVDDEGEID
jgi:hypothetical protein